MRYYYAIPIFLVAFLLQTTIIWRLPIFGYSPNLIYCLVVVFSFLYEERYGLILGLVFGMLLDISTSLYFGVQTISLVFVCLAVRLLRFAFNHEKFVPDVIIAAGLTPVNVFIVWTIYHLCGLPLSVAYPVDSLLPLVIMHAIIVLILHLILVRGVLRFRQDRHYSGGMM
jgi:rod shape-determining protein MreD